MAKKLNTKPILKSDLSFPNFDDIKVSTKTFTATTNLDIKIDKLFEILPITNYVVTVKKRGRKKKGVSINQNEQIKPGSIVTVKFQNILRGVELKPKKTKQKKRKWFRNSITVVIILDKPINFKVCRNGTFQMTGCKTHEHAEECVKNIWNIIKDKKDDIYTFTRGNTLETLFIPSMRNIDFSLGFLVDREKLNKYICTEKKFHCLLETSFGYTGVNIKVPLQHDIKTMKVIKLIYDKDNNMWEKSLTTYNEYLELLTPKEKETKLKVERYNTFLVFHSGKIIVSGLTSDFMRQVYYDFTEIIKEAFDHIEERLDVDDDNELTLEEELAALELEL